MIVAIALATFVSGHIYLVNHGIHFRGEAVDFGVPPPRFVYRYPEEMGNDVEWRAGTHYLIQDERSFYRYSSKKETYLFAMWPIDYYSYDTFGDDVQPIIWENYQNAFALKIQDYLRNHAWTKAVSAIRYGERSGIIKASIGSDLEDYIQLDQSHPNLRGSGRLLRFLLPLNNGGTLPHASSVDRLLRPLIAYHRAFLPRTSEKQAQLFLKSFRMSPHSREAEKSLIMIPRVLFHENRKIQPHDFSLSNYAIDKLIQNFPHSRFRLEAEGWKVRPIYLTGHYHKALRVYQQIYNEIPGQEKYGWPIDSIILCDMKLNKKVDLFLNLLDKYDGTTNLETMSRSGHEEERILNGYTTSDAKSLWKELRLDPADLSHYLDYRMAFTDYTKDLLSLAGHTLSEMKASPYQAHIDADLAQIAFKMGNKIAVRLVRKTLNESPNTRDEVACRFIRATIANREGRYRTATTEFEQIAFDRPHTYLSQPAMENLTLLYERAGHLGKELDLDFRLHYAPDIAFMIDARMSTSQVRHYFESRPHLAHRNLLVMSYGYRLLKDHRYADAMRVFSLYIKAFRRTWITSYMGDYDPINSDGLEDPYHTAKDLLYYQHGIADAGSNSQKAELLYEEALYIYHHKSLLFYNPALWRGARVEYLEFNWNSTVADSRDRKALHDQSWDSDCVAETYRLCKQIVNRYPDLAISKKAAYLGGCAIWRLSGYNTYWEWMDYKEDLEGKAVQLMKFASLSPDPLTRKRATKFEKVFSTSRKQGWLDNWKYFQKMGRHYNDYAWANK